MAQQMGIDADDALRPVNERLQAQGQPPVRADQRLVMHVAPVMRAEARGHQVVAGVGERQRIGTGFAGEQRQLPANGLGRCGRQHRGRGVGGADAPEMRGQPERQMPRAAAHVERRVGG